METTEQLWIAGGLTIDLEGPNLSRSKKKRTVRISKPFARCGRSPSADIVLDHPSVSDQHLYLHRTASGVFFLDLGSETGVHYCTRLSQGGWIQGSNPLMVGPYRLRVRGPWKTGRSLLTSETVRDGAEMELLVADGSTSKSFPIDRSLTLIGRQPPSDPAFPESTMEKVQLALFRTADRLWAVDLSSDGEPVLGRTSCITLHDGQEIVAGSLTFAVRIRCEAKPAVPLASEPADDESSKRNAHGEIAGDDAPSNNGVLSEQLPEEPNQDGQPLSATPETEECVDRRSGEDRLVDQTTKPASPTTRSGSKALVRKEASAGMLVAPTGDSANPVGIAPRRSQDKFRWSNERHLEISERLLDRARRSEQPWTTHIPPNVYGTVAAIVALAAAVWLLWL